MDHLLKHRINIKRKQDGFIKGTKQPASKTELIGENIKARIIGDKLYTKFEVRKDDIIHYVAKDKEYRIIEEPVDAGGQGHHIESKLERVYR